MAPDNVLSAANAESPARTTPYNYHRYARLTIGARLAVCFAAIALLMIGGDAIAVWQFGRVEASAQRFYETDQRSLAVMRVHLDVVTFRETLSGLARAQDGREFASQAASLRDDFLKDAARFQASLSLARDADQDPTILTRLQTVRAALPSQVDLMLELVKTGDWEAVQLRLGNQVESLVGSSSSLVENVDREVAEERVAALESADRARRELSLVLPVTAVLILLMATALGWYATRAISRPLAHLGAGAQALARGDFECEVEVSGSDELAELGGAFNYAARQLRERKRAEEALRQAQADLAYINRATTMGELTASLAHEIRQPITAALTNARTCVRWLSRDQPDSEEARVAASRIVEDLRRAEGIISRIRLLFKRGNGQREWIDVNEVIREMIVLLRNEANQYSISIRTQTAENLPRVMADRVQLQQVFMNLMLNGIEAMKSMSTPAELTIRSQRGDNGDLLVSISDTGVGLLPEQADQLFEAFFTTKPDGTGMGLPISRSIIESHGGRLWAGTNAGRGATFHFTLPGEAGGPE